MESLDFQGLRVAIYARYSSDLQTEHSLEDQVRRLREFAEKHGAVVPDELVFADGAMSGESGDRPDFERLIRLATGKPRQVDVILVEDLSRLSRSAADLFGLQRLFEYAEVRLMGLDDGIDTFASHSALTFGLKSLVSSMYIKDLRDKTLRGLEGRALAGLATGGVGYGYRLRAIVGPDGRRLGSAPEIDEAQAKIVQLVFQLCVDGCSLSGIAKRLRDDGVEPPRVNARNRRRGWKETTIRAMLHNERYAGIWKYKERKWRKVPGTSKRRPVSRDPKDVIVSERPELRIINAVLWEAVQGRLRAVRTFYTRKVDGEPKGRAVPGRATPYLFSGLLFCGKCGAPMVISGGSSSNYYRCSGRSRGACENPLSVREDVTRLCLLDELRRRLLSDAGLSYARKRVAEQLGELSRDGSRELAERRSALARIEGQLQNLVDHIAEGRATTAVTERLRALEAHARRARADIARVEAIVQAPVPLPSPDELVARAMRLSERLCQDIPRGREELRRVFRDGRIDLLPQPGGFYVAKSEILPLVLLSQVPPSPPGEGGESRYTASGCAGRI